MGTEMASMLQMQGMPVKIQPFLGPAFLVSMGYADPGKWATVIEGGSRFGFDLVWLLMLSNMVAILCQSLAVHIGLVTGKHLAQICGEEYPRPVCILLWLQCEVSVMALELTMILGTAIGFNLLLDLDMLVCVILTTADALLFPLILPLLGKRGAEVLSISLTGLVLLFFLLDTLSMDQNVLFIINGMFPRMKRESLYTAVSFLGANIMPHNFYLHSAIVQEQKRMQRLPLGTLCHYNFLEIAFAFSGTLLVNVAMLSSAASTFHNAGLVVLTFQDAQPLMEQILKSSIVPVVFFLALFCASQLSTLTSTIGGQVALQGFLGVNPDIWLHRILIKAVAIAPALLCVWKSGTEGIYQLLIFSQVILALQLPSAVIPLFRVASASSIMGPLKISLLVEGLAWLSFFWMLILNLSLVLDVFLGDSEWMGSARWNMGIGEAIPFVVIIVVAFVSFGLMLWLIATPLRSANDEPDIQIKNQEQKTSHENTDYVGSREEVGDDSNSEHISSPIDEVTGGKEPICDMPLADKNIKVCSKDIVQVSSIGLSIAESGFPSVQTVAEDVFEVSSIVPSIPEDSSVVPSIPGGSSIVPSIPEGGFPSVQIVPEPDMPQLQEVINFKDVPFVDSPPPLESASVEASLVSMSESTSDSLCTNSMPNVGKISRDDSKSFVLKEAEVEVDAEIEKDDDDGDGWEHEDTPTGMSECASSLTYEEPGSGRSIGGKSDEGSGSGSLSRLSGLGRAARRQFAAVLDEFWGKLFDFHGQVTQQARLKKMDLALGIKVIQTQAIVTSNESAARDSKFSLEQEKRLWQKSSTNEHWSGVDSCMRPIDRMSGVGSSIGTSTCEAASASWVSPTLLQDSYYRRSVPSLHGSERRYSSLRLPSYHEDFSYQPATIHGYQTTSYMGRSGAHTQITNTVNSHNEAQVHDGSSFSTPFNNSLGSTSVASGFDELQTSGFRNTGFESCGLPADQSIYKNSFSSRSVGRTHDTGQYMSQTKKYRSLPDISDRGVSQWDSYTRQENDLWHPLVYRATGELDMRYGAPGSTSTTRTIFIQPPVCVGGKYNEKHNCPVDRVPLAFDELSPSQLHKDAFSLQSTKKTEDNSLWSRQPFEQLFGMRGVLSRGGHGCKPENGGKSTIARESVSCGDSEVELLQSLRYCIVKLLRLEGSEWLFRQDGGSDEDLIDLVAARERILYDAESCESYRLYGSDTQSQHQDCKYGSLLKSNESNSSRVLVSSLPHCGEGCVWGANLVISFGIWCVHRILELSLMESRPELWGKYTYVLNRLQGILEPAFSRPHPVPPPCFCLQIPSSADIFGRKAGSSAGSLLNGSCALSFQSYSNPVRTSSGKGKGASASVFLEIIKDVELAVGARKGRTGTAAGDVAFPKGKENLASVLKRYKRRLANKPPGTLESGGGNRKALG